MLIRRRLDDKGLVAQKQPKFNLKGLFKRKNSERDIDSDRPDLSSPLFFPSYTTSPYTEPPSSSIEESPRRDVVEDRYAGFKVECISLQNSEMTSHVDLDEELDFASDPSDASDFDPKMEESPLEYRPGGYHPVMPGDVYTSEFAQYRIVRKLGWGHFSTVWLAQVMACTSAQLHHAYVAIKVVKLGRNYAEAAEDEIRILGAMHGPHVTRLHDHFLVEGPNGKHICMAFELLGENILHIIIKHKAVRLLLRESSIPHPPLVIPLSSVKVIARQLLEGIDYMHRHGVIHTDIKPENILLSTSAVVSPHADRRHDVVMALRPLESNLDNIHIKIADLGNATYTHTHFTNQIQTRQYRLPEIILKYKQWGASADVWSFGCVLFELITGDYLFDPHDGVSFDKDEDHLAQVIELLGEFPPAEYLKECKLASKYFCGPEELRNIKQLKFWSLHDVLVEKYKFEGEAVRPVADLILKCLRFDLDSRYDCGSLLHHEWFTGVSGPLANNNHTIKGFTCTA